MLRVLQLRDFRLIWLAGLFSSAGSEVSRLALMLHLVRLDHGAAAIALWIGLRSLPGILAAPWIGPVVDRYDRKRLLILADLVRAVALAIVAFQPTLPVILAAVLFESIATAIFDPSRRSVVPQVVPANQLEQANSLDQTTSTVILIAGPAIGAKLFLLLGIQPALLVDAASYLISALFLTGAEIVTPPGVIQRQRNAPAIWGSDLAASWSAVKFNPRVRCLIVVQFISLLCTGLWAPLAPAFIRDFLHAPESQLGWQFSAFGAGGAAGAVIASRLPESWPRGRLILSALFLESLHMVVYSLTPNVPLSLLCLFSWGATVSLIIVASTSYLQATVDPSLHGRTFTLVRQAEQLGLLMAMALAAGLSRTITPQTAFTAAGAIYALSTIAAAFSRGGQGLAELSFRLYPFRETRPHNEARRSG